MLTRPATKWSWLSNNVVGIPRLARSCRLPRTTIFTYPAQMRPSRVISPSSTQHLCTLMPSGPDLMAPPVPRLAPVQHLLPPQFTSQFQGLATSRFGLRTRAGCCSTSLLLHEQPSAHRSQLWHSFQHPSTPSSDNSAPAAAPGHGPCGMADGLLQPIAAGPVAPQPLPPPSPAQPLTARSSQQRQRLDGRPLLVQFALQLGPLQQPLHLQSNRRTSGGVQAWQDQHGGCTDRSDTAKWNSGGGHTGAGTHAGRQRCAASVGTGHVSVGAAARCSRPRV